MHSPGATGQEGQDSQTFSTGVHPLCPGASADNPTHGYRIRELEDFTAEFRQQSRCNYIYTLGEYIYCMILLCGLLIYDQQDQLRRRTNDYSVKFTPNPMVWQVCNFFWNWMQPNNIMLVGIFIGVALIVPTQTSPMDYCRQQAGRLFIVGIMTMYWISRQLLALAHSGPERYRYILARLQVY